MRTVKVKKHSLWNDGFAYHNIWVLGNRIVQEIFDHTGSGTSTKIYYRIPDNRGRIFDSVTDYTVSECNPDSNTTFLWDAPLYKDDEGIKDGWKYFKITNEKLNVYRH